MTAEPLLAKARPKSQAIPADEITLVGDTSCVLAAAAALFGGSTPSVLGRAWLRFFDLTPADFSRFRHHLRAAAAAHDWGKANSGFQAAVTQRADQVIRHEHLSALMLVEIFDRPTARAWLREAGIDLDVVLAAVVSNHVKAREDLPQAPKEYTLGAFVSNRDTLFLEAEHPDFADIWASFQKEVDPSTRCPVGLEVLDKRWDKAAIRVKSDALKAMLSQASDRLRKTSRWIAAVRAGLIAADAVGSAVVRMDRHQDISPEQEIRDFIERRFGQSLSGRDVWEKVTLPRVEELRRKGRWRDDRGVEYRGVGGFSEFQCEVARRGPRVLLTAPCGSGKTLAAWNWIEAQVDERRDDRPIAWALFLYPTRATATEGSRDYVS